MKILKIDGPYISNTVLCDLASLYNFTSSMKITNITTIFVGNRISSTAVHKGIRGVIKKNVFFYGQADHKGGRGEGESAPRP